MSTEASNDDRQPTRTEVERMDGAVLLEFGASWCGHCKALAPKLARLLEDHPDVHHVKIEDGPGKPLGRSFGVKLWPTLLFLKDGKVVKQSHVRAWGRSGRGLKRSTGPDGDSGYKNFGRAHSTLELLGT